jgi:signal peptidase II
MAFMNHFDDQLLPSDEQPAVEQEEIESDDWTAAIENEAPVMPEQQPEAADARASEATADAPLTPTPAVVTRSSWKQRLFPFAIASLVLALDQFTKYLVETGIPLYQSWAPIPALAPFFRLTHTSNTGAAFGLFQGGGGIFAILATIVAGAIIYYTLTLPAGYLALRLALGLQLGGALGNLVDRVQLGHVTDFLDFGPWPVFNLADTAVVTGVLLLAWIMLQEERAARQTHDSHPYESEPENGMRMKRDEHRFDVSTE